MFFENNLFRRKSSAEYLLRVKPYLELKAGQYTGNDDDFKERVDGFNQLEYHDQIQLVKEMLAAKNARLEEVVRR